MSAARELVHLLEELEPAATTVMDLVGAGRHPRARALYPSEDGVFDRATGNQFYFHAHEAAPHEAGHFRTVHFFPTRTVHLVAISMAENGWPQALFTVNLWAIGDVHVARLTHPDVDPFEDRSLEVLSRIAIDLRDDALSRRHT